jgi:hypothetical protein
MVSQASTARLIPIKRARERELVPNTRAHVGFADGSIKVLEQFCGQNLTTKCYDKRLNMYLSEERATNNNEHNTSTTASIITDHRSTHYQP